MAAKNGVVNGKVDVKADEDEEKIEEEPDHPVDKGWAWVILASCWFISCVVIGIAKSYGIFFIEFLKEFKASVSATTFITTLQTISYCATSVPILAVYIKRYNTRYLAIISTLGCALSYGLSSFATSISFLYFSQSLLFGSMTAGIMSPNLVILGKYFKKRRGLAMGIMISGNSLGGFVLPYLFRYLFDEYGLRGGLIITAGLSLQCVVAACLLRPIEFYSKRKARKPPKMSENDNGCSEQQEKLLSDKEIQNSELDDGTNLSLSHPVLPTDGADGTSRAKVNYRVRSISYSPGYLDSGTTKNKQDVSTSGVSLSSFSRYLSNGDIFSLSLQDIDIMRMNSKQEQQDDQSKKPVTGCWRICQYLNERDIFNFNIFRNKYFLVFLPAYCFGSLTPGFAHMFVPAYASELGIGDQNVATVAAVINLCDFFGRLFAGVLADIPWIRKTYLVGASQFVIGIMMVLSPMFNKFYLLIVFAIIYGLFGGFLFTLFSPIIIELVGLKNLPNGMLVLLILQGFWISGNASFLGYLRDLTGSYNATLQFMGASAFTSATIFIIVEIVRKMTSPKDKEDPA